MHSLVFDTEQPSDMKAFEETFFYKLKEGLKTNTAAPTNPIGIVVHSMPSKDENS